MAGRSYKIPNWDGLCVECGKSEAETKFGKGAAGTCNYCSATKWKLNNALKIRCQRLYGNAQKRAKEQGWPPPDFSSTWIEEKVKAGYCEVTGIPFDLDTRRTKIHACNPWVPSLDRIDSSLPYLKSNVQVVVFMYNVCKAEFSHADVVLFAKSVVENETNVL